MKLIAAPVLAALAVAVVLGVMVGSAAAHDSLEDTSPASGAHEAAAPNEVLLTFSGPPLEVGSTLLVVDADGENWVEGATRFDGNVVAAPLRPGAPDGYYQVRWRVVSGDGAVMSGHFDYSAGDVSDARPVPEPKSDDRAAQVPPDGDAAGDFEKVGDQVPLPTESTSPWRTLSIGALGAVAALSFASLGVLLYRRLHPEPNRFTSTASPEEQP